MNENYVSPYLTSGEDVLVVRIDLACAIGLNEAIMINQIHYWLERNRDERHLKDGRYWIWQTYEGWHKQIPFLSVRTLKRTITSLRNQGLIEVDNFNKKNWDRTMWYTINYEKIDEIWLEYRKCQNVTIVSDKMAQSEVTDWHNQECQLGTTNTKDYNTKTTTETTTENSKVLCISGANAPLIENRAEYMKFVREVLPGKEAICNGINYFLTQYRMVKGHEHLKLKGITLAEIAKELEPYEDFLKELIDRYFDTEFREDYCGLSHFVSEGVLARKACEVGLTDMVPYSTWA